MLPPARTNGKRVFAIKRMTKDEVAIGALLYPERNYWRPTVRSECANVPRPCPYVTCRHHIYLEAKESSITMNFPDTEPWELEQSCTLDLADAFEAGMTLDQVGRVLGVTRERVRQLETVALSKFLRRLSSEEADALKGVFEQHSQRRHNWDIV